MIFLSALQFTDMAKALEESLAETTDLQEKTESYFQLGRLAQSRQDFSGALEYFRNALGILGPCFWMPARRICRRRTQRRLSRGDCCASACTSRALTFALWRDFYGLVA